MPRLTLHLLGGCRFALGDVPLRGFVSRKAEALLVYLAVTRRSHSREALASLLWSEVTEQRAAGNLRVVLSNLRRLAPDHLDITRRTVSIQEGSDWWTDTAAFESLAQAHGPEAMSRRQEAVALYQGDFLEGFYLRDALGFEEWMLAERERLRQMALWLFHQLVEYHAARGEYSEGIDYASRLLALDPWREEAHRQMMRLLALSGQRSAALAQYHACRRMLRKELGLEPLEETTALYEHIRRQQDAAAQETREGTDEHAPLPFVGRGEAYATLRRQWEEARKGGARLTLVTGEAGVGKSRLMEEIARYVQTDGALCLKGQCYEFGSAVPYQPVVDALRTAATAERVMALDAVWLAELSRLLPDLRRIRPDLPPPIRASDDTARQRLFEAVARFLQEIASVSPLLFFLDDLQWADQATLDLLHYLVRRLGAEAAPIWLVGAYRSGEVGPAHPLTRLRQGLGRDHRVYLLPLERLPSEAVTHLARSLVGREEAASLADFLYWESEGSPFVLTEVVSSLREQGALVRRKVSTPHQGEWQWRGASRGILPTGVQDVILQRVGRLSEEARQLLEMAAVIGRTFNEALLREVSGLPAERVAGALAAWVERRLVTASAPHRFDFSHDKIRAVVYHALDAVRRQRLHQRVGEALTRLHHGAAEEVCEQLAYHFERAGADHRAVDYYLMAAEKARSLHAHREALRYCDNALALHGTPTQQRAVLLGKGMTLYNLGHYEQASALWREVAEAGDRLAAQAANALSRLYQDHREYEEAHRWAELAQQWAAQAKARREEIRAVQMRGKIAQKRGDWARAQALLRQALAAYREVGDEHGVAECLEDLGSLCIARGHFDEARHYLEEALTGYRRLGDRGREAECIRRIGVVHWRQGRNEAAYRLFAHSLALCRTIGDRQGEAASLNTLGMVYIVRGDVAQTQQAWEESARIYRDLGLDRQAASAMHNLAILHMDAGEYEVAQRYLQESVAVDRATGSLPREALDLGWLGKLHLLRGEYGEAQRCLEQAIALDEASGGGMEVVSHYAWLGALAYEQGDVERAEVFLKQALRYVEAHRATSQAKDVHVWLALVHLAQGREAEAIAAAQKVLALVGPTGKAVERGSAYSLLGEVYAGVSAPPEEPERYFEQALELLPPTSPLARSVALRRYGAYLLRRGERERGHRHLREAEQLLARIGAMGELRKVKRLLEAEGEGEP